MAHLVRKEGEGRPVPARPPTQRGKNEL
jgi:hypothetical protein